MARAKYGAKGVTQKLEGICSDCRKRAELKMVKRYTSSGKASMVRLCQNCHKGV